MELTERELNTIEWTLRDMRTILIDKKNKDFTDDLNNITSILKKVHNLQAVIYQEQENKDAKNEDRQAKKFISKS